MSNEKLNSSLDKWDYIIATSSGVITAAMDVLWVKDINLKEANKWGSEKVNEFVMYVAKKQEFKGNDLCGAIKHLEKENPLPADKATNEFGGGLQHHLRDFSHHPTITGLIFSILTQFTGTSIGTDKAGNLINVPIPKEYLATGGELNKIYKGIVSWIFHLISDMAGSSGAVAMGKEGTGIPGPFLSLLKELSSAPLIKNIAGTDEEGNSKFSLMCSKLFNGTLLGEHDENGKISEKLKFDLRTEIGIGHEAIKNKQYLPVILNELVVRGFYSVRRFMQEIKTKEIMCVDDLMKIETSRYLPWNSRPLTHMLMLSSATFSVIDISSAGIKAAIKNKNNKAGFALDFIQGVNLFGTGRLVVAGSSEVCIGIENLYDEFVKLADSQLEKIGYSYDEMKSATSDLVSKIGVIAGLGTPLSFVSASVLVFEEISKSLDEYKLAKENRIFIEEKCKKNIEIILVNRKQIDLAVTEYMSSHISVFANAFEDMDKAIKENDTDLYISGNKKIQKQLGKDNSFGNMSEFDEVMSSTDDFRF